MELIVIGLSVANFYPAWSGVNWPARIIFISDSGYTRTACQSLLTASSDIVTLLTLCCAINLSFWSKKDWWSFHIKFLGHTTMNFLGCFHYFLVSTVVFRFACLSIYLLYNSIALSRTWFALFFALSPAAEGATLICF